ncbi:Hypothetical predicted protein [Marmota monax]|uniref:Uncharacterized protein n=1 Tax=Marmota monax TaxID=9995 RepID=A0A5E4CJ06_MARMO|nr:Hypothetical predicted protein [Marmota monax]
MPYLLWTIKRDVVDYHSLTYDQMLNHYAKTASFTTKIGLCVNMRSLPWYVQVNPDSFFPRCYSLCTESEKQQFLEDFRRTVASSILKWVVSHQNYNRNRPRRREEARQSDTGPRKGSEQPSPGARASGSPSDSHWLAFPAFTGGLGGHDPHPTVAPELTVPRVLTQERTTLSRSPCGLWT